MVWYIIMYLIIRFSQRTNNNEKLCLTAIALVAGIAFAHGEVVGLIVMGTAFLLGGIETARVILPSYNSIPKDDGIIWVVMLFHAIVIILALIERLNTGLIAGLDISKILLVAILYIILYGIALLVTMLLHSTPKLD